MLGRDYEELITPEEIFKLYHLCTDELWEARQIQRYYIEHKQPQSWDTLELLTITYAAGRIQGIREERQSRRERQ